MVPSISPQNGCNCLTPTLQMCASISHRIPFHYFHGYLCWSHPNILAEVFRGPCRNYSALSSRLPHERHTMEALPFWGAHSMKPSQNAMPEHINLPGIVSEAANCNPTLWDKHKKTIFSSLCWTLQQTLGSTSFCQGNSSIPCKKANSLGSQSKHTQKSLRNADK